MAATLARNNYTYKINQDGQNNKDIKNINGNYPSSTANISALFHSTLLQKCGKCVKLGSKCRECLEIAAEQRLNDHETVYVAALHDARSGPVETIGPCETASGSERLMASRDGAGMITIEQRLELMGFPRDYFDGAGLSESEKIHLLGNALSGDACRFLLFRVLSCFNIDDDAIFTDLMNSGHLKPIDEHMLKFGERDWRTGAVTTSCSFEAKDRLPAHVICVQNIGMFEVLNVGSCMSSVPVTLLNEFLSYAEMEDPLVFKLTRYINRVLFLGGVLPINFTIPLLLRFPGDVDRLSPPVCQLGVADADLLPDKTGFLWVAQAGMHLPVEVFFDKRLEEYGRKFETTKLADDECFVSISPVRPSGISNTADLLGFKRLTRCFKVKKKDVCLSGTNAALAAFLQTQQVLAEVEHGKDSLEWRLFSDGITWNCDVDASLRGEDCSTIPTLRTLRAIAVKHALYGAAGSVEDTALPSSSQPTVSRFLLHSKRHAAVCAGHSGAYVSSLEEGAVGMNVCFWWDDEFINGTIVKYDVDSAMHTLDVSTEKKTKRKSKKADSEVVSRQFELHSHKCILTVLGPENYVENKKMKLDLAVNEEPGVKSVVAGVEPVFIANEKCRAAVLRICTQGLINFGHMFVVPGASGVFVKWRRNTAMSPTTLNDMLGLSGSNNKGLGEAPCRYFQNVREAAVLLWRYLTTVIASDGETVEFSLDFAAPLFSPPSLRAIMPVLSGPIGAMAPKVADISYFYNLDDAVQRELRLQFLTLICATNGALPCTEHGTVASVTMWIGGVRRVMLLELP